MTWGTGIWGLMRGMATLPQGNQKLLAVKDKVGRPPVELRVSRSIECDIFPSVLRHCWLGDGKGISSFFYSILRWSVLVSTMCHQSSWIAAFLQADARPMFCWQRSASTAQSQVWLGLPNGRFQSGGSPRITAATARWWSSCGELRAVRPNSRKRLSATRWERMASGGCSDFHILACKKLGVGFLVVTIWLELWTKESSSCHHHLWLGK